MRILTLLYFDPSDDMYMLFIYIPVYAYYCKNVDRG